jgi:N-acetylmuramic acid 6-phosphate (MurNAc-6-P) etherase
VDRGARMVRVVAGGPRYAAGAAIAGAGGSARTAIDMRRLGLSRGVAEQRLAGAGNRLREILGDPPPLVGESG